MVQGPDNPKHRLTGRLAARARSRRKDRKDEVAIAQVATAARRNDLNPNLRLENFHPSDLTIPDRKLRDQNFAHTAEVMKSITTCGFVDPVIVTSDRRIVDGVTRLTAARELGFTSIPCLVVDHLDDSEIRILRLALNRTQERGGWNLDELRIEFEELLCIDTSLEIPGFEPGEIDFIVTQGNESANDGANILPVFEPGEPIARLDDCFILNQHRLICADATEPISYERLMRSERAHMVNTDPPYRVKIEGVVSGNGAVRHKDFVGDHGNMSETEYQAFADSFLAVIRQHVIDGAAGFFFTDWRSIGSYLNGGSTTDWTLANIITWNKGRGGMGSPYRSASEFAVLFKSGTAPLRDQVHLGRIGRDRTTVWDYPGATQPNSSAQKMLAYHPTPKSVEMIADSILDLTERGDLVLDPFCGSGTSIIAGEKTGRRVYAVELDPKFVDIIVRRWMDWTGQKAIHEQSGMTFDELGQHRAARRSHASGQTAAEPSNSLSERIAASMPCSTATSNYDDTNRAHWNVPPDEKGNVS